MPRPPRPRPSPKRLLLWIAIGLVAIQFIPYGRDHVNPGVLKEPAWDSPDTRALVKRACFDCHSNETVWPGYANVAPVSWLIQNDVDGGRRHLNFSEWNRPQEHADDAAEQVRTGEMPLGHYTWLHEQAKLTDAERAQLASTLAKMFPSQNR